VRRLRKPRSTQVWKVLRSRWTLSFMTSVVLAWSFSGSPAQAVHSSYSESRSFYIDVSAVGSDMQHLGCEVAQRDRRGYMTLFFGAPVRVFFNGSYTYGVTRFGATDVVLEGTANSVSNLTKNFAIGYSSCASGSEFIRVGIGTSNCIIGS
jgi:hypothetical protein